jgi:two-component system, chemotaxis family, chemotaxis protein CheY
MLAPYGECHIAINGKEVIEALRVASEKFHPYDLICLDIMMPEMDGHEALKQIRAVERAGGTPIDKRVKIIMTTALGDEGNVLMAIRESCDAYLVKPIQKAKLLEHLKKLGLIQ